MFEENDDVDFGDEFNFDFEKIETNKRPAEAALQVRPKKAKIIPPQKSVVKRKFPGPAGILPDRKDFDWSVLENTDIKNEDIACSQMSMSVFHNGPWDVMSGDYEALIEQFDIKWVKKNANLNKLPGEKAPFLGAIIKSIESFEGDSIVKVTLKDPTGEIQGMINRSLYKQYSSGLVTGSVIVLRQCGVLTTSYSSNHYITIAPRNLVAIYCKSGDGAQVIKVQELSCDDLLSADNRVQEKENVPSCSQVQIKGSREEVEFWENALAGVDVSSIFSEDF